MQLLVSQKMSGHSEKDRVGKSNTVRNEQQFRSLMYSASKSVWHVGTTLTPKKLVCCVKHGKKNVIIAYSFRTYLLILNVILATHFKQVGTGATKTGNVVECSKNICLEHSTGKQVIIMIWYKRSILKRLTFTSKQHVITSRTLQGHRITTISSQQSLFIKGCIPFSITLTSFLESVL